MLHGVEPERDSPGRSESRSRQVIDGVRVGGREVWSFFARDDDDPAAWLFGSSEPVTVCRSVGPDGVLEMGYADPDLDDLLSIDPESFSRG